MVTARPGKTGARSAGDFRCAPRDLGGGQAVGDGDPGENGQAAGAGQRGRQQQLDLALAQIGDLSGGLRDDVRHRDRPSPRPARSDRAARPEAPGLLSFRCPRRVPRRDVWSALAGRVPLGLRG